MLQNTTEATSKVATDQPTYMLLYSRVFCGLSCPAHTCVHLATQVCIHHCNMCSSGSEVDEEERVRLKEAVIEPQVIIGQKCNKRTKHSPANP